MPFSRRTPHEPEMRRMADSGRAELSAGGVTGVMACAVTERTDAIGATGPNLPSNGFGKVLGAWPLLRGRQVTLRRDRPPARRQSAACSRSTGWSIVPNRPCELFSTTPLARTAVFMATLAILDPKNIPQTDPCAARR